MTQQAVSTFQSNLRGRLVKPTDSNYDEVRALYNGMIDKRPSLIARCVDVADVITSVNFAREQGLLLAIRGGGHNAPGLGSSSSRSVKAMSHAGPHKPHGTQVFKGQQYACHAPDACKRLVAWVCDAVGDGPWGGADPICLRRGTARPKCFGVPGLFSNGYPQGLNREKRSPQKSACLEPRHHPRASACRC